jgi:hypothetical protein
MMKKGFLFICILLICLVVSNTRSQFSSVSAQNITSDKKDNELAETIKRLTNRSSDDLNPRRDQDGSISIDLQGRFQNVLLSKTDSAGTSASACVTSLEEANLFFEKDLETGQSLPNDVYRTETLDEIAARHGMSKQEFVFYQNLIAKAGRKAFAPNASIIAIQNNNAAGQGFNDPTPKAPEGGNSGDLGQQRLNLFMYAAGIWSAFLDSNVPILIRAQFAPLACTASAGVLGSAGTASVHSDFPNAEFAGTWYPQALANKQRGIDNDGALPDINATFNSSINNDAGCLGGRRFYLGFDNTTPPNTTNLLVIVLHEMGHGLGFSTFANGQTGALFMGLPDVYTTFMYDRTQNLFWNEMTNAQRQASAINPNNVLWDGANVKNASGFLTAGRDPANGRVELFTPNPFQGSSLVSHFNSDASPNLLMEPAFNLLLPLDLDLTRQQMRDIGWYRDTTADLVPDTITNVTPGGGTLVIGSTATVNWTNNGGFSRNVIIELSTDGGATFPTVLGSGVINTGSFNFTVPNNPTTQGRIRVREDNFVAPAEVSAANLIITAPTAASVTIQGRIFSPTGRSLDRARVSLTNSNGETRTSISNSFGYYRFEDVGAGQTYIFNVSRKGFSFNPQVVMVNEDLSELNFTALP